MTYGEYNKILIASILLITSLFFCLVWEEFQDKSVDYTFPYVDISNGQRSPIATLNPSVYKTIPLFVILPFLVAEWMPFVYIGIFLSIGRMPLPYIKDVWIFYLVAEFLKGADFMLTFRTTPFRVTMLLLAIVVQAWYCIYSHDKLIKFKA